MNRSSSDEIEWWRNYFKLANMDVFEVIEKAIDVAAQDFPDQMRFRRYCIAQKLFSGSLKSSWDFEALALSREISDENSVIISPVKNQDCRDASNPKHEGRPSLILKLKRNRSDEKDREAKGEATLDCKQKVDEHQSKKRAKKASRKGEEGAAKSGRKRKGVSDEVESLMLKPATKVRFVHGFH